MDCFVAKSVPAAPRADLGEAGRCRQRLLDQRVSERSDHYITSESPAQYSVPQRRGSGSSWFPWQRLLLSWKERYRLFSLLSLRSAP